MDFAAQLQAIAASSGQKSFTPEAPKPVEKSETMDAFASALGKVKAAEETKAPEPQDMKYSQKGPVPTWSFSGLKSYETCAYMTKLHKVDGEPQIQGEGAARGNVIHDALEAFVRGDVDDLPKDSKLKIDRFETEIMELRGSFPDGHIQLEEKWAIRDDWSPTTWDDPEHWGKAALDVFIRQSETSAKIVDYKTGRKFGNEMKHGDQGLCYALHVFHRFPEVDFIEVEFWYLDQGEKMCRSFGRRQLAAILPRYHRRAEKMTTETKFIAKPNGESCRFCPYGSNKNKQGIHYGTAVCKFDWYLGVEK